MRTRASQLAIILFAASALSAFASKNVHHLSVGLIAGMIQIASGPEKYRYLGALSILAAMTCIAIADHWF